MERGYIRLYRKKLDSDIWQYPHADRVFEFLMLSATYRPHKYCAYGTCIDLLPGQYISSIRMMAQKCRLSLRELRTSLTYLKSTHRIAQQATHQYSIFTILNWDCYQNSTPINDTPIDTQNDTGATQERHTGDTGATQKQEVKNLSIKEGKERESIVPRAKSARFTPPTLEEVSEYCKARGNGIDPIKFHASYTAKDWKMGKTPMKNWKAAVVTWERSANQ